MRLSNKTSVPDDLLRDIVRFVKPSGISKVDIEVRNTDYGWTVGYAYAHGCGYHYRATGSRAWLVTIRIPKKHKRLPCVRHNGGAYLDHLLLDETEDIVGVIAHEFRHLWQKEHPKGWRVWGARGQYSERDADAYAIRMIRAWRRARREESATSLDNIFRSC